MHYWIHYLQADGTERLGTEHNRSISGDQYKSRGTLIRYGIRPYLNGRTARVEVVHGNKYGQPSESFTVSPH
jgi:hypothetical protein